ncbi:MAG: TetR/AcrR family transcriptional regulator [Acidimicrobiales bacterium]|nr:TetR/AcrR family transcriptional regulator [Acidimicrobiales bacterium]HRW39228.1 TetR/AcrR family transcriptional regulator [Aquihabitans sp.]
MARPRSEQAHRAAIAAAVEVLLESGVEGMTLDEVATRSGVAKSTLYRHFGSKEGLIATAARGCVTEHPTPDTGDLERDFEFLFSRYQETDDKQRFGELLPMLIDAGNRDPQIQAIVDDVLEERRRPLRTVLRLAQLRGEIGPDLDLDNAMAMILGPISYRRLVERREVTPEFKAEVVRGAIVALRATAGEPASRRSA